MYLINSVFVSVNWKNITMLTILKIYEVPFDVLIATTELPYFFCINNYSIINFINNKCLENKYK